MAGSTSVRSTEPTRRATRETDVVVAGAGPTGLLIAGDLAAAGHRVTLVERRERATNNLTRALTVHARTLEMLDARGLADELVGTGNIIEGLSLFGRFTLDPTILPSRFPFVLVTGQYEVERLLERRAREAGVTFLHGTEVTGLRQDEEHVEVDVRALAQAADALKDADAGDAEPAAHAAGTADAARGTEGSEGETATLCARYLVGADGLHSTVRQALGLPFPGKSVLRSMVLADVRLAEPPPSPFLVNASNGTFGLVGSFGDGWYRVMGWSRHNQLPDSAPVGLEEVREVVRKSLGSDFGLYGPRWISRFHSDERQSPAYRSGRAFLAGDAAHVHSPAGGMGMNTGIQDAANLSWKLAAVLRGHSSPALLATYDKERHPVGRQVLRASGAIIRLGLTHSRPGVAARGVVARLLSRTPPLARRAVHTVSGIGISYPASRGAHPLAGKRAPDLPLTTGRLYEALRAGTFVLVTPRDSALPHAVVPDGDRFLHARASSGTRQTLLVRPDGYIAWAAEHPTPEALCGALRQWTSNGSAPASTGVRTVPA